MSQIIRKSKSIYLGNQHAMIQRGFLPLIRSVLGRPSLGSICRLNLDFGVLLRLKIQTGFVGDQAPERQCNTLHILCHIPQTLFLSISISKRPLPQGILPVQYLDKIGIRLLIAVLPLPNGSSGNTKMIALLCKDTVDLDWRT